MSTEKTEQELKDEEERKQRDELCIPIAQRALQIIAEHNPDLFLDQQDKIIEAYTPIHQEITKLCLEKNLTIMDVSYTMSILQSAFENTKKLVLYSLQHNFQLAQKKLFKTESEGEVRMQDIDAVLKSE